MIDEIEAVSEEQMDSWVKDFDSWDVCDQICGNLFDRTPFAYKKAVKWSKRDEEFVKRAGEDPQMKGILSKRWSTGRSDRLGDGTPV